MASLSANARRAHPRRGQKIGGSSAAQMPRLHQLSTHRRHMSKPNIILRITLFAIAMSGASACTAGQLGDDMGSDTVDDSNSALSGAPVAAEEDLAKESTEHPDSENDSASSVARRALIGMTTITIDAAACGKKGDTSKSVRVNNAAFDGAAQQRSGSSTSCTAVGALQPTDDTLYYCFTCTTNCSDTGSWTYNKNIRTGVSGWTRNDLLRPESGDFLNGSSRPCPF